jgi:hypothetical protein
MTQEQRNKLLEKLRKSHLQLNKGSPTSANPPPFFQKTSSDAQSTTANPFAERLAKIRAQRRSSDSLQGPRGKVDFKKMTEKYKEMMQ